MNNKKELKSKLVTRTKGLVSLLCCFLNTTFLCRILQITKHKNLISIKLTAPFKVIYQFWIADLMVSHSVWFRHRTWNHICWLFDSPRGRVIFHYNDEKYESEISVNKFQIYDNKNQFVIFGQEPDTFKGGFDKAQVFQGKLSRFNLWSFILEEDLILRMAECYEKGSGDIVNWTKDSFEWFELEVEEVDDDTFCNGEVKYLFLPGRRRRDQASLMCAAHGGWIVAPKSNEENQAVHKMYMDYRVKYDCKDETSVMIGWLGVQAGENQHFISKPNDNIEVINFTNFQR